MVNVLFTKVFNKLTGQHMIVPRVVNQQTLHYDAFCEYLADGSTVTAADVQAVMKLIETRLPLILSLNSKVVCSPEGLTFRPKVSGSLTQAQLKARLEAKLADDPTLDIDVNREIETSDLTIKDLVVSIAIEMPSKWDDRFASKAELKRVTKATAELAESGNDEGNGGSTSGGSSDNGSQEGQQTGGGSDNNGGENTDPEG